MGKRGTDMNVRRIFQVFVLAGALAISGSAFADASSASTFVEGRQQKITQMLKSNAPAGQVGEQLDKMLDYDELVRRCFLDDWEKLLTAEQRTEVTGLLKQLIQKRYRGHIADTLPYTVSYTGEQEVDASTWRVKTVASRPDKPREQPIQVHYLVRRGGDGFVVVEIIANNSKMTENYHRMFHDWLTDSGKKYPYLKSKLLERLNKR